MQLKTGALVLVLVSPLAAQAGDARLEIQATSGYLAAPQLADWQGGPMGGLAATLDWRVADSVHLGVRFDFDAAEVPYGNSDGEPTLGERSGQDPSSFESSLTFLPRAALSLRFALGGWCSLDLAAGIGLVSSAEMEMRSFLPHPAFGLGLTAFVYQGEMIAVGLHARADALVVVWTTGTPFLIQPQAGLSVMF